MAKYLYPAVFTQDESGYAVRFPDVNGCFTCGDTLIEAFEMAEDALALMLFYKEEAGHAIPDSTPIELLNTKPGEFTSYIICDTKVYWRSHKGKTPDD
jgi:predicted RNase H-like HicB family nuclease